MLKLKWLLSKKKLKNKKKNKKNIDMNEKELIFASIYII